MKNQAGVISIIGAALFLGLFYRQDAGVNQSIFGLFSVGLVYYFSMRDKRSSFLKGNMIMVVLLSIAVAWHGETWSRTVLLLSMWVMAGAAVVPALGWPSAVLQHAVTTIITAQGKFLTSGPSIRTGKRKTRFTDNLLIYILPVAVIGLFLIFYSRSNPVFSEYLQKVLEKIGHITDYLRFGAILTFLLGLLVVNIFIFKSPLQTLVQSWASYPFQMTRMKPRNSLRSRKNAGLGQSLRHEYKAAIFLILSLNVLLFLLNIADMKVVWIGFEWNGQLLKSFVHEGTWYLIISILISVGVIVFFFRGNLNFYSLSPKLRTLVYIWLAQNAFLALSVALRNYHYVEFYGLAYKRIGVFFFLGAIFTGLILVWLKVKDKHTYRVWMGRNIALVFTTLSISALFDWSAIITKYNLSHYRQSFVHMEFLMQMPDHTLPVLESYRQKLGEIKMEQEKLGFGYEDTLDNKGIGEILDSRIARFKEEQSHKTWQEWCFSDSKAMQQLELTSK